jgi:hypothetical protein
MFGAQPTVTSFESAVSVCDIPYSPAERDNQLKIDAALERGASPGSPR